MGKELKQLIKAGDIILFRGTSWLSRSIQFVMKRYRKRLGLAPRIIYNHAAMIVTYKGEPYVVEANAKGIEASAFDAIYINRLNKIKIISPKKAYTKVEKSKISDVAINSCFRPTRYDFFNFFYQIDLVLRTKSTTNKKWLGPKEGKAEKRLYCTEAVATWANKVRPNTFNKPWSVNPLDVDLNKYYKEIYNGIKA